MFGCINNDLLSTAWLISLCEKKMGIKSRLPRKNKKLIKRYMLFTKINHVIYGKQNIFMKDNGCVFTTHTKL